MPPIINYSYTKTINIFGGNHVDHKSRRIILLLIAACIRYNNNEKGLDQDDSMVQDCEITMSK